ncbi:MAG: hypothetical protein IOD05_19885 [Rhodobacter sp.]|nr:hypothetical protein [Rhodobacter sp.]MCA3492283.1 hypothetical protein [Rhodobacter sp.]MCA3500868.1 hypothetical protein [Rhodobacter sp.]MCA3505468.1 hypothetical protein [Rhodobacter sp.]MCA3517249.1 hypothetical protein [Rhodobacter sp.]
MMTATPAQVANDLAAQATFFAKRDDNIACLCRDSLWLIRALIGGQAVDERFHARVILRLEDYTFRPRAAAPSQIDKSLDRALVTLKALKAGRQ